MVAAAVSTKPTPDRRALAGVEVAVFGPLRMWQDDGELDCGGETERSLLAALLLWAGQPVEVERLVRTAWDDQHRPRDPVHAVRTHVMRVRQHIGTDLILTSPHGYRIALQPSAVDAHRFVELSHRAEHALRRGRHEVAERLLVRALRVAGDGDPWVDLAGRPTGEGHRAQLRELRRRCEERRTAVGLRLDRAPVGEPERLVAEEPLREQRWELLMRAQVLSGRQADALRSYRSASGVLRSQLGIDPGPALQRLELEILRQDATLYEPDCIDPVRF